MLDVSIIIVNWNTRDILRDCLNSIAAQAGAVSSETIVVDNASSDGSVEMIKADFPWVHLIANQENRGFAAANNQALDLAQGRYLLLLNSDTVVLDRAIEKTVTFADSRPSAAVVGCLVLNADRTVQNTCFMFHSILNDLLEALFLNQLFPRSRFFGRAEMTWWSRDDVRQVDVVSGCFMLVRRAAYEQVGPMDEGFFMYAEEADWCYRFHRAGWQNIFTPHAEIIHLHGASSAQRRPEMTLQLRGSCLRYYRKHHGPLIYGLGCIMVALFFALRIPIWLFKSLLSSGQRRYCLQRAWTYARGTLYALLGGRRLCLRR